MGISQIVFYAGVVMMVCAAVGAVIALVAFRVAGKRLDGQMEDEYGPNRR